MCIINYLELISERVSRNLLAHALLIERSDLQLIVNIEELVGAIGGVTNVDLHGATLSLSENWHNKLFYIFYLRFGWANAINNYLRLQIRVESIKHFIETGLGYKITFRTPCYVLWIHKGYFVIKSWCEMFVIKVAFRYTKYILDESSFFPITNNE